MNVIIVTSCLAHVLFANVADAKTVKGFKKSKWTLLKKCNARQWDYVINFLNDFFKVSDSSIEFFLELKPLNEEVKHKNRFFVYK